MLLIDAIGVRIGALILPGIALHGVGAFAAVILIALVNAVIWPTLSRLVLPFSALTLGLGSLVLSGAMIWIAGQLTADFRVDGILWGIALAFIVTVVNVAISTLLGIDDEGAYWQGVVRRAAQRHAPPASQIPGVLFLEIDGLAHEVIQRAMRNGHTPELSRWLDAGTHRLDAMGVRLVQPDRGEPGRAPARQQRQHARIPVVREGSRGPDGLQPPA